MPVIPKKPEPDQEVFGPAEACWFLNLKWDTIRDDVLPQIAYRRVGRKYLIPKQALVDWLNEDDIRTKAFVRSVLN